MSFVPLLFGRPALLTNWITLAHAVCAPSVVTLPKLLLDRGGMVVPAREYCDRHGHIFEAADAALHGLTFRDNAPEDILHAVVLMHRHVDAPSRRAAFPPGLVAGSEAPPGGPGVGLRPPPPAPLRPRSHARGGVRF